MVRFHRFLLLYLYCTHTLPVKVKDKFLTLTFALPVSQDQDCTNVDEKLQLLCTVIPKPEAFLDVQNPPVSFRGLTWSELHADDANSKLGVSPEQLKWVRQLCAQTWAGAVKIKTPFGIGSGALSIIGGGWEVFTNQHVIQTSSANEIEVTFDVPGPDGSRFTVCPDSIRFDGCMGLDYCVLTLSKNNPMLRANNSVLTIRACSLESSPARLALFHPDTAPGLWRAMQMEFRPTRGVLIGHPGGGEKRVTVTQRPLHFSNDGTTLLYNQEATQPGSSGSLLFPLVPLLQNLFCPPFAIGLHFASGTGIQLPAVFAAVRGVAVERGSKLVADLESLVGFFLEYPLDSTVSYFSFSFGASLLRNFKTIAQGYVDVELHSDEAKRIIKDADVTAKTGDGEPVASNDPIVQLFGSEKEEVDWHYNLANLPAKLELTLRANRVESAGKAKNCARWYYKLEYSGTPREPKFRWNVDGADAGANAALQSEDPTIEVRCTPLSGTVDSTAHPPRRISQLTGRFALLCLERTPHSMAFGS